MKKTLLSQVVIGLAFVMFTVNVQAEFKMGYVDIQKAIQSSKAGKKAKEDMMKEAEKKKKEFDKKNVDIEKMREDLEKKKSVLSEEAFGKKAQELQEEMGKFQQAAGKAQQELQKKEADLISPILEKMKKVIEAVAKSKGLSMVIQSSQTTPVVVYASAETDITEEVIKSFDKEK